MILILIIYNLYNEKVNLIPVEGLNDNVVESNGYFERN